MSTQIQDVAPVKLQAPTTERQAAVVEEAEGNKGVLLHRMQAAFKAFNEAEASLSKGLAADAVLSIVPLLKLPTQNRPKYAVIAETIVKAMNRELGNRTVIRDTDDQLKDRFKTPAYRQQATRWVALARWECGLYNKSEQKHQERIPKWSLEVKYDGQTFTSPVSMLRHGVAYTTVYTAFRNCVVPTFIDFTEMPDKVAAKLATDRAKKLKVTVRKVNDKGETAKLHVPIAGHSGLTFGAITGLISEMKSPFSQSQYDKLQAALLLAKPSDKPDNAPSA